MNNSPLEVLKTYWNYSSFRGGQEEIIQSVIAKNDTLALLPTGGGKSICFQVPALLLPGVCLVISPLIALMKDQVFQLRKRGIPAAAIYSGMHRREIDIILDNCIYGNLKFLYLSPERISTDLFAERVKKMKVGLIAVDEAHCISQWGYDFRPPYLNIADLRVQVPEAPVIALTASATPEVQLDIQERLKFRNGRVFKQSFARANLSYSCFFEENKEKRILEILNSVGGSAVVYVRNRRKTKELSDFLNKSRIPSEYYHAGLSAEARSEKQDKWINNGVKVMVATNAFGMGIDKPDVRVVINAGLPENIESYYQEAGRAGRDGKRAYAVLLYNNFDLDSAVKKIEQAFPETEFIRKVYQALANYFKIASGAGLHQSFDFDLEEFVRVYNLPKVITYNALKRLENQGFLELNEAFYNPSKIYFTVTHEELYRFQVANPALDPLIKTILRVCGGEIFTGFVNINESFLAKLVKAPSGTVIKHLEYLDKAQVLIYDPKKEKPQIILLTPRLDAAKLPLNTNELLQRKEFELAKAREMSRYAENRTLCRTLFILQYFSENSEIPCGICDICLDKAKNLQEPEIKSKTLLLLNTLRDEGPLDIQTLASKLSLKPDENFLLFIRQLLDNRQLCRLESGKLDLFKDD